ncbi:DUF429 domain-containing protein [Candidatus Harpocratesius sp.]
MDHIFLGVDGCRGGWIVAVIHNNRFINWEVFETIQDLWSKYGTSPLNASRILIDIPIGLVERGLNTRECDAFARSVLKRPRSSSIFNPPCRSALYAKDYDLANKINRKFTKKGISIQAWNISKKIKEVDLFLRQNLYLNRIIWESHPEICFWALNQKKSMKNNKRSKAGIKERLTLLKNWMNKCEITIETDLLSYGNFSSKKVQKDDKIDSLVLALTATGLIGDFKTFPENPTFDELNLPQRIVYSEIS